MTPSRPRASAVLARFAIATLVCALVAGCQRKPQFVPASADTSLAVPKDSLFREVQAMQNRWSASDGENAARLTADLVLRDLRAHAALDPSAPWELRARAYLDSLDVGAELASAPCAIAVNFFQRSDPTAGSWPWVFWCAGSGGKMATQAVEGRNLSLVAITARDLGGGPGTAGAKAPGIAVLFARRGGAGQQPLLMAWRAGARLDLAQTLGPDSLGGTGTGSFESAGDSGIVLSTRTWQPTPRFDECATCPHVYRLRRFLWRPEGFARIADQVVDSPYGAFVRLIQALAVGDQAAAAASVAQPGLVDAARRAGWGAPRGPWRAAPGSEGEAANEMAFYRGASEAWKVHFVRRGGVWLVESFEPTTRVIE